MKFPGLFCYRKKLLALLLLLTIFCDSVRVVLLDLLLLSPEVAEAAVVVIEGTPNTAATAHISIDSSVVFISDLVGYKFYRSGIAPTNGGCVYRKTTNGGASWGTAVAFDTQTDCIGLSVWYDRWTPGDTGTNIHMATIDTTDDEIFYNRLDTSTDTLLSVTSVSASLGLVSVYAAATNLPSISKATNGTIYVTTDDANGTFLRQCSANCNLTGSWSNAGTPPQGNADSFSQLQPLASGSMMLINRSTGNILRSSTWNGSVWTGFTTIAASAVRNTTYDVGVASVVNRSNNDIYVLYAADNDTFTTADHDIRSAVYSGGSWTAGASIFTNHPTRGILQVALARDENSGDLYAAYTARTTIGTASTANVYYVYSTTTMSSWSAEVGPINSVAGDFYGITLNQMSDERIYASWFDNTVAVRDIFGETIADIGDVVQLSATGTQLTQVRDNVPNFYSGGTFVLSGVATRTVSSVTITESGTIDADNDLENIKLFYDADTSAPYNCASESYSGGESQFGATLSGGFTGANGTATFNASPQSVNPTRALCFYVVMDVPLTAQNGDTIELSIDSPDTDITISGSDPVFPVTPITLAGTTTVVDPNVTQFGYHWRLDNGSEVTASSATAGVENTPLATAQIGVPRRLRVGIANQGSTTTLPTTFQIEYGEQVTTCSDISSWQHVNTTSSAWNLFNSSNLTNGNNTTDIAVGNGGITNLASTTLLVANGGVRDTSTSTGSLSLDINRFFEAEFSLVASTSASGGTTYCFRVTRDGEAMANYLNYPSATVTSDVLVGTIGTQILSANFGTTSAYAGGAFRITEGVSSRNVTSIKLAELGTIDGATELANLKLVYDLDTSAPYNCSSESYGGAESQFGTTSVNAFSGVGQTATFNGSVGISTTSALCLYVIYDISVTAQNGDYIDIEISSPDTDVIASGGAFVGPSSPINISGTTTVEGAILTQLGYHFRNDNGSEAGATSATGGTQNTPLLDFGQSASIRLRFSVSNAGSVSNQPTAFRIEYATKITTCADASSWTDVGATSDSWNMKDSTFVSNGDDTTNIAEATGGVPNGPGTFIASNGGFSDTDSSSATNTLPVDDYLDVEYSITATTFTAYNATYCFRVSAGGMPLTDYDTYAELTTQPKRDFKIQRGFMQVTGLATTVTAGVHYTAPASTSRAFVRITGANQTGSGNNGAGVAQNADDVTAYIANPQNIATSFTIARPPAATSNTRVDWEIIEFIGKPGTDNDMIVRTVATTSLSATALVATGTAVSGVNDNSKIVVFLTGVSNRNASRNYYAGHVTTEWNTSLQSPIIRRTANGASIIDVGYAVVEFTGQNWLVQREEHTYAAAGVTETEAITSVNSLAHTFIHAQKRMGATTNVVHYGHEVWLSSIGAVSFQLEAGASVAVGQTSVAWIIENIQTGNGEMNVQRSNGNTTGGTAPLSLSVTIPTPLGATNNTSISANARAAGANTNYPLPLSGFRIASTTAYQIYRSITSTALTYRVELIEWPVADLIFRQTYYRLYADNNLLTPTDPWPPGPSDLGENTSITVNDEPLAQGDRLRVRLALKVVNASLPALFQDFKLQYGLRVTTCSAIAGGNWFDVGAAGGGTIWRGYSATGTTDGAVLSTDPPTGGDLLISISDRAGSLVETNPSALNPYAVDESEDVEYDWFLEHNGAAPRSTYCFRVVKTDNSLMSVYNNYPQIRTADFTPVTKNWRWYSDEGNETPTTPLANENVSPINITNNDTMALRVTVRESRNVEGNNIKFKLQFSDDVSFTNPVDVVSTTSCQASSLWCYTAGAVPDNTPITTSLLSDSDSCVAGVGTGCGSHNSSPASTTSTHTHPASDAQEYSFTVRHVTARVNAVYYFRLYDVTNNRVVSLDDSEAYPSVVTEGASLQLSVLGLPAGTSTSGLLTDVSTVPGAISFGDLAFNDDYVAAHRLAVETNATEGYQVFQYARQPLLSSLGAQIASIPSTNFTPQAWNTGCLASSTGCVGYHTTDSTLRNGSTRFAVTDTFAGLVSTPAEVMYSSIPASDTHDIVYRIRVNELQPAGFYETEIVYLAVPSY